MSGISVSVQPVVPAAPIGFFVNSNKKFMLLCTYISRVYVMMIAYPLIKTDNAYKKRTLSPAITFKKSRGNGVGG